MRKKPSKADPFNVWGKPPQALAEALTARQMTVLRRYVETVANSTYRLAFDNGVNHGLCLISETASKEMRKQRNRMARS